MTWIRRVASRTKLSVVRQNLSVITLGEIAQRVWETEEALHYLNDDDSDENLPSNGTLIRKSQRRPKLYPGTSIGASPITLFYPATVELDAKKSDASRSNEHE